MNKNFYNHHEVLPELVAHVEYILSTSKILHETQFAILRELESLWLENKKLRELINAHTDLQLPECPCVDEEYSTECPGHRSPNSSL